jgi:hypothetical protein
LYIDTWHRFKCDGCVAVNWLCYGDINDLTVVDDDSFVCWRCDKINVILQDGEENQDQDDDNNRRSYSRGKHYVLVKK